MKRIAIAGLLVTSFSMVAVAQQPGGDAARRATRRAKPAAAATATPAVEAATPAATPVAPPAAMAAPAASVPVPVQEVAPSVSNAFGFPGGKMALQGMYPNGGSQVGSPAVGLRKVISPDMALSGWLQLGYDKAAKTNSFGLSGKLQKFLRTDARALPYAHGLVSLGKNGGDNVKGEAADMQVSLAGGFGVEVFLIPEISTFVEGSLGVKLLPSDTLSLATSSAAFGLSYNFDL